MSQIKEFKKFITRRKPTSISYLSENQDFYDPCKLELSFTNILISENPSVICLVSGDNRMRINMVKSVKYDENITPFGVLITIISGVCGRTDFDHKFTFIAS